MPTGSQSRSCSVTARVIAPTRRRADRESLLTVPFFVRRTQPWIALRRRSLTEEEKAMKEEGTARATCSPSGQHANVAQGFNTLSTSSLNRHSVDSGSPAVEQIGILVRRAMACLDSDREAARRWLRDAATILSRASRDSSTNGAQMTDPIRACGLARWQAKRALAYIEDSLGSKIEVREISKLVGLSSSHFSRAFKRSFGLSPMGYVSSLRVERAKLRMTSTRAPLIEIALACGFADQSHFSRSFSRRVGVSPGLWRRNHQETLCETGQGQTLAFSEQLE